MNKPKGAEEDFDFDDFDFDKFSMNSVYLEKFRKRKNEALIKELEAAGITVELEKDDAETKPAPPTEVSADDAAESAAEPVPETAESPTEPADDAAESAAESAAEPVPETAELPTESADEVLMDDFPELSMDASLEDDWISDDFYEESPDVPMNRLSGDFSNIYADGFPDDEGKKKKPPMLLIGVVFGVLMLICLLLAIAVVNGKGSEDKENVSSISDKADSFEMSAVSDADATAETTTTTEVTTTTTQAPAYRALEPGEKGKEVRKMQERLYKLGYITKESCTGYYGEVTQKYLKIFQKNVGLPQTGIADSETLAKLYADDAPKSVN